MGLAVAALLVATTLSVVLGTQAWAAVATTPGAPAAGDPVSSAPRHPTARVCPDNGPLLACFAIRQTDTVVPNLAANALPNGYGPTDLRSAYNLTATGGAAMTVAIIDAYDDPNAESDLATYRSTYSLPACLPACLHHRQRLLPQTQPKRSDQPVAPGQHRLGR